MTSDVDYQMRVELLDIYNNYKRISYKLFRVGVGPDFTLTIEDFSSDVNWFTRDALDTSKNKPFSTRDLDRDEVAESHCAKEYNGAGW